MKTDQIPGQMTIFDFLKENTLDSFTGKEIIAKVAAAVGIDFQYSKLFNDYRAKIKGVTYSLEVSNYSYGEHKRCILIGADMPKRGCGRPCDSIEEAIAGIEHYKVLFEEYKKEYAGQKEDVA